MKKMNILAILGSTRKNSSNENLLKFISKQFADTISLEIFRVDTLPHFNPDLDHDDPPVAVADFRKLIRDTDALIFSTPEYVFSLPGSLKNAIDWNVSTDVFAGKPMGLFVAAASGDKALESLLLILSTVEAKVSTEGSFLIKGARGKIRPDGAIDDLEVREGIIRVIEYLLK